MLRYAVAGYKQIEETRKIVMLANPSKHRRNLIWAIRKVW